jgi:hypothetical protein
MEVMRYGSNEVKKESQIPAVPGALRRKSSQPDSWVYNPSIGKHAIRWSL